MNKDNEYLLLFECAQELRCSVKTIRRLLEDGILAGCKIRGRLRVLKSSFEQYKEDIVLEWQLNYGPAKYPGNNKLGKEDKSDKLPVQK